MREIQTTEIETARVTTWAEEGLITQEEIGSVPHTVSCERCSYHCGFKFQPLRDDITVSDLFCDCFVSA